MSEGGIGFPKVDYNFGNNSIFLTKPAMMKMRSRYTICLLAGLILLAGIILPAASLAGTNTWTTNGPSGGEVLSLALSPNFASDSTLFAGTWGGGVFKSTDRGSNWSAVISFTNLADGQPVSQVGDIAPGGESIAKDAADGAGKEGVVGGEVW